MSYADDTLATFTNMLGTLDHLCDKAQESGSETLLTARLAEDMFPLAMQIRVTLSQVCIALIRVGGEDLSLDESDIASFDEARRRIAATRDQVKASEPAQWLAPDARVEFTLPNGMAFAMSAAEYIRDWTLPQFYFHLTASYAILRAEGLEIGKTDYVPHMMRYLTQPASA